MLHTVTNSNITSHVRVLFMIDVGGSAFHLFMAGHKMFPATAADKSWE